MLFRSLGHDEPTFSNENVIVGFSLYTLESEKLMSPEVLTLRYIPTNPPVGTDGMPDGMELLTWVEIPTLLPSVFIGSLIALRSG